MKEGKKKPVKSKKKATITEVPEQVNHSQAKLEITYLYYYGIGNSYDSNQNFISRSKMLEGGWAKENGIDIELGGYWADDTLSATNENYFVVQEINKKSVSSDQLHNELYKICKQNITNTEFSNNIVYFASNSSTGYQYPILSEDDVENIDPTVDNIFEYYKILRYAFASSYAYSLKQGTTFPFASDSVFKRIMIPRGATNMEIVSELKGSPSGIYAVAIKVPSVKIPNNLLEEEIIIAYKGTSNVMDSWQDFKLAIKNFFELDKKWQQEAYDFCAKILKLYPPNDASLQQGYKKSQSPTTYNVVLTGHSLGGYTAIETATRTGVACRVFSAPATKIIANYISFFADTMYLNNVINFYRDSDPIATISGRHYENRVAFPSESSTDPFANHYLEPFIKDILMKMAYDPIWGEKNPRAIYILPNALLGAGLSSSINRWGGVKFLRAYISGWLQVKPLHGGDYDSVYLYAKGGGSIHVLGNMSVNGKLTIKSDSGSTVLLPYKMTAVDSVMYSLSSSHINSNNVIIKRNLEMILESSGKSVQYMDIESNVLTGKLTYSSTFVLYAKNSNKLDHSGLSVSQSTFDLYNW